MKPNYRVEPHSWSSWSVIRPNFITVANFKAANKVSHYASLEKNTLQSKLSVGIWKIKYKNN